MGKGGRPQQPRTRAVFSTEVIRTGMTLFAGFMVLVAISAVVLSFYGPAIEDTSTYRNLSEVLPPVINLEIVAYLAAAAVLFLGQAFAIGLKADAFEFAGKNPRRRKILSGVAAGLLVIATLMIGIGHFAAVWGYRELASVVATGLGFGVAAFLSAVAIGLMYFVLLPPKWHAAIPVNLMTRAAAFGGAVILLLLLLVSVQVGSSPKLEVAPVEPGRQQHSTHSISAILEGLPNRMGNLSSSAVTLKFRLTPFNPNETGPRYPVSLDPKKQYAVSGSIEGTGFDVSALPETLAKPRPVEVNELMTWTWLVAPKSDKAGSRQILLVRVFLHDRATGQMIYSAPIVTHTVEVRTPLGLPAWALSPSVTIGAVLIDMLTLVGNFLLPRILPKADAD